ncbi:MAG: DUF2937 family protein [Verrucomicrobiota bacterium]
MKKIWDYSKLVFFVAGVLIGIQVPGFVDQYGKSLESRLLESRVSVSEFQDDADKFFEGDLGKLIAHYEKTNDPVINAGGESISAIVSRNQFLENAFQDFNSSLVAKYFHVFATPVTEIQDHVWSTYTYGVVLNAPAIYVGLLAGVLFAALGELSLFFGKHIFKAVRKGRIRIPLPEQKIAK